MNDASLAIDAAENNTLDRPTIRTRLDGWLEWLGDRFNPILVKEVRQALKGRIFVVTFFLLLLSCWAISTFGAIGCGESLQYSPYAREFFACYFLALIIAIFAVVPLLTHLNFLMERNGQSLEMLSITSLNMRRIISGKLASSLALTVLCFAAITPFIGFTALMQGFQLGPVVCLLITAAAGAFAVNAASLFAATLAKSLPMQMLVALGVLTGCFYSLFFAAFAFEGHLWVFFDWSTFWGFVFFVVALILAGYFLRELAIARMTFKTDNRSTGIRLVGTLIVLFLLVCGGTFAYFDGFLEPIYYLSIWALIGIAVIGFFACTEPSSLSRRVTQNVSKINPVVRVFGTPWLPGCFRGFIYVVMHVGLVVAWLYIIENMQFAYYHASLSYPFDSNDWLVRSLVIPIYIFFYAALLTLLTAMWYRKPGQQNRLMPRILATITIVCLMVVPHIVVPSIEVLTRSHWGFGIWYLFSPFASLAASSYELDATLPLFLSIIFVMGLGLSVFLVPFILRDFSQMISLRPQPVVQATPGKYFEADAEAKKRAIDVSSPDIPPSDLAV